MELAGDGREAVERIIDRDAGHYDAVLMDLQMPVLDGLEATREILRRVAEPPPIIAMTAHATREERAQCLRAGMRDHVAKPVDPRRLITCVAAHTRRNVIAREPAKPFADPPRWDGPAIAGIDTAAGIARLEGDQDAYRRLLAAMPASISRWLDELDAAGGAADTERLRRLGHSVRGAAGGVGALDVQAAAHALETACGVDSHTGSAPQQAAARLRVTLTALAAGLSAGHDALQAGIAASSPSSAIAEPSAELERLLYLIETHDLEARSLLRQLEASPSAPGAPDKLAALREALDGMRFADAAPLAKQLLADRRRSASPASVDG